MFYSSNIYFVLFTIYLVISIQGALGQRKQEVYATGKSISKDLTPKEGIQEAINEAKSNALRRAGVKEQLSVSTLMLNQGSSDSFSNFFNEISTSEMYANVVTDSILDIKKSFDDFGNMVIEVGILATIYKSKKNKDPSFFFNISGIRDHYYVDDRLSFSFTPSHNGFLKIFAINEYESFVLYPYKDQTNKYYSDDPNELFLAQQEVKFPIHESFKPGYSIDLDENTDSEHVLLIFVFTKSNIHYIEKEIDLKSVLKWIFNIPVDQRFHLYKNLIINSK